jgi:hypothetical protein
MTCFSEYASASERKIVNRILDTALAEGYMVSVYDGEVWTLHDSTDGDAIREALASTDMDVIRFRDSLRDYIGDVHLVWGNDEDVISDTTCDLRLDELLRKAKV